MRPYFLCAVALTACFVSAYAQEVVSPLGTNHRLQKMPQSRVAYELDTLILPFVDDFSNSQVHPDPSRWMDRDVYINGDIAFRPLTLGVATFDGLDAQGKAYDNSSVTTYGQADFLSSQAIDLSGNAPGDSIYLSFYLQPQGLGDAPEARDSMVLQFYTLAGVWESVYRRAGSPLDTFRRVMMRVDRPDFLHAGFRFRFVNYASLTGFVDLWHLDYVRMEAGRSFQDTTLDDIAFRSRPGSLLKHYQEMPYQQYLADSNSYRAAEHGALSHNMNQAKNTGFTYRALELERGTVLFSSVPFSITFPPNSDFRFTSPLFPIPLLPQDSITIQTTYALNAVPDVLTTNDTVSRVYRFWNYYAYDDGIAESAYGLNILAGQIAYKFQLSKPDSIRGVSIHFVQTSENVASELFNLKVWRYIPEGQLGGSELVLYEQTLLSPEYEDSLGQYYYYPFDQAVAVSDSFYIGWQQGSVKILNLGLDRNQVANDQMFFNTTGTWEKSTIQGAWMMRPVVGKAWSWPASQHAIREVQLRLFPNPAADYIRIEAEGSASWRVFSMLGTQMGQGVLEDALTLDLSSWPTGIYFFQHTDKQGRSTISKFAVLR